MIPLLHSTTATPSFHSAGDLSLSISVYTNFFILPLIRLNEKPSIGNTQYPPYYSFECDSILNITVSPNIFNQVEENEVVVKESHSSYLKIENNLILYLDSEEYQWLP